MTAQGCRTDNGSSCMLVVINEADGSWSFYGQSTIGVKLSKAYTVALAESILAHAR